MSLHITCNSYAVVDLMLFGRLLATQPLQIQCIHAKAWARLDTRELHCDSCPAVTRCSSGGNAQGCYGANAASRQLLHRNIIGKL